MKATSTLFMILFMVTLGLQAQETMVAGWTFPDNSPAADTGTLENQGMEISTLGGTSEMEFKNGYETKAAQASAWNDGAGEKAWVVQLSTLGFTNLTVSSRQQSGGNDPGPKFFQLEYSLDAGITWIPVDNGAIEVENDWETSFVDQLPLPEACEEQEQLAIRWLMTSEEASGGAGPVLETGKSKIDEIYFRGELSSHVAALDIPDIKVLVGSNHLSIQADRGIERVMLTGMDGRSQAFNVHNSGGCILPRSSINHCGIVVYTVYWKNYAPPFKGKVFLP